MSKVIIITVPSNIAGDHTSLILIHTFATAIFNSFTADDVGRLLWPAGYFAGPLRPVIELGLELISKGCVEEADHWTSPSFSQASNIRYLLRSL